MQKGLLEQQSLAHSSQLGNPRAGGNSAHAFLPQGQHCSDSKVRQAFDFGALPEGWWVSPYSPALLIVSCLSSHPIQIVTAP